MKRTQDMLFHSNLAQRVVRVYTMVVMAFKDFQSTFESESNRLRSLMLTVMKTCLKLLSIFVKDNPTYKTLLIKDLDVFLEFTRYNVGQSDLLADLFSNNNAANFESQKKLVAYFAQKIITEGNQTRFLDFFDNFVTSKLGDADLAGLTLVLDTFLPYALPQDQSDNLKLIYGFVNKNTSEHEMYLLDDFAAFREEKYNDLIAYKSEPFFYHRKLLELFLKLLGSGISNIAKIRLRKYFTLNYLIRFLSEFDAFFEGELHPESGLPTLDHFHALQDSKDRHRFGITYMKPIVSELLYRVYCDGERNVFRTVVSSLNVITNLMARETERLIDVVVSYEAAYSTYVSFLLKSFMKFFDNKLSGKFDPSDFESAQFIVFMKALLERPVILTNKLTEAEIGLLRRFVEFSDDDAMLVQFNSIESQLLIPQPPYRSTLDKNYLEHRASMIVIKDLTQQDVWDIAMDELKSAQRAAVTNEMDRLAALIQMFDNLFEKDLRDKYGISFKTADFLDKIMTYLSNTTVTVNEKMVCLDFLSRFVETHPDGVENAQNLLNDIGFTKTCLTLLADTGLTQEVFMGKIVDFLTVLLRGGNRVIQRSVHQFFDKNVKMTGKPVLAHEKSSLTVSLKSCPKPASWRASNTTRS